jgi:hypothetical protein
VEKNENSDGNTPPSPANTALERCRFCGRDHEGASKGHYCPNCGRKEVLCESCSKPVSDVAETCPSCGHPQPKKLVTEDLPGGNCGRCGTFNLVRPYDAAQYCRGCVARLEESCPQPFEQYEADQVNFNAEAAANWAGPTAAAIVLILAWLFFGSKENLAPFAIAWIPALFLYGFTFETVRNVIRKNGYQHNFGMPSKYADRMKLWPSRHKYWLTAEASYAKKYPQKFWTPIKKISAIALAVGIGGPLMKEIKKSDARSREENRDREKRDQASRINGRLLGCHIMAANGSGLFGKDLILTNTDKDLTELIGDKYQQVKPMPLSRCELSFMVTFESGVQEEVKRVWDAWAVGEDKVLSFPNQGKVRVVNVKGVLHSADGKQEGLVDFTFDFKPKK